MFWIKQFVSEDHKDIRCVLELVGASFIFMEEQTLFAQNKPYPAPDL